MVKERRIPNKTKSHNVASCDGDISQGDETDREIENAPQLGFKAEDTASFVDSAYGTIDAGSVSGSIAVSRAISDFESINFDLSDTEAESEENELFVNWSDDEDAFLRDLNHVTRAVEKTVL